MNLDRAIRAQALLDSEDLSLALQDIEQAAISRWRSATDSAARESEWHFVKAIESLRGKLKSYASDKKIAEAKGDAR